MFSCAGRFDPYKHTSADMARVHALIGESLMDDPENQIKGRWWWWWCYGRTVPLENQGRRRRRRAFLLTFSFSVFFLPTQGTVT